MNAICVEGLSKRFASGWPGRPGVTALEGLSFSVRRGEIYGFLGPNGAGKTTTLKILLGLMKAGGGRVEVLDRPAGDVAARRGIGFLPESPYFYDYLTADEFLDFYGHLAGLEGAQLKRRKEHLLELVGLVEARGRQLRKFSKGMLQRIGLAQALIHDPELVVLDEPMSGLDPIGRKQVRDLIAELRRAGKTVFFSTHIISDVEALCDRVGVVTKGRLLASGTVDELVGRSRQVEIVCEGLTPDAVRAVTAVQGMVRSRDRQSVVVVAEPALVEGVLAALRGHGAQVVSLATQRGSLEDLFVRPSDRSGEGRS